MIKILTVHGQKLTPYLTKLGELRIKVFSEWPYIYEGDLDYEIKYLQRYVEAQNSFVALAFDGEKLIGATTAIYLPEEELEFKNPFIEKGYLIDEVVYFGESLLLNNYRGQGLGKVFMELRHEFALKLEKVKYVGFCSVVRPQSHPLRPSTYRPLDLFWTQCGFNKIESMLAHYKWKDRDRDSEDTKDLQFWVRTLKNAKGEIMSQVLIEKYYRAFNNKNWNEFFGCLDENVIHDTNQGGRDIGKAHFQEFMNEMNRCYDEKVLHLVVMVDTTGRRAAAEFTIEGTYLQSQKGLPAAKNQKYSLPVGAFFEIDNGKIKRITNYYNLNDWIKQVQ